MPIPGTRRINYLQENIASAAVSFTDAELEKFEASITAINIVGERYTEEGMKGLNA